MKATALLASLVRSICVAAATGAICLGLLVGFHPFDSVVAPVGSAAALSALQAEIADAKQALATTQAALVDAGDSSTAPQLDLQGMAQQLAAARDRAELDRRHAQAIRNTLARDGDLSGLAEIRDSVVVGQLLNQRAVLAAQLAEQAGRLGPSHPTMRALRAQMTALLAQIAEQASTIAAALEAEASIEDAEVERLRSLLSAPDGATQPAVDLTALRDRAIVERARLDRLMESYLALQSAPAGATPDLWQSLRNPVNLLLAGIAALAALAIQFAVGLERRQARRRADADLDAWASDQDTIAALAGSAVGLPQTSLRRAS